MQKERPKKKGQKKKKKKKKNLTAVIQASFSSPAQCVLKYLVLPYAPGVAIKKKKKKE